LISLLIEASV